MSCLLLTTTTLHIIIVGFLVSILWHWEASALGYVVQGLPPLLEWPPDVVIQSQIFEILLWCLGPRVMSMSARELV